MDAFRYWHTIRHLRPVQICGRVWFRINRPRPDYSPAPGLRILTGDWRPAAARPAAMVAANKFQFLNETGELNAPGDWNAPGRGKLWLYNLHYFDDLNGAKASERQAWHQNLIATWIADNSHPHGNGWEPYPLSLRIVNWVKWVLAGNDLRPDWLESFAVQTRYLHRRLEWHLLGNHLFANAKALVFAGVFCSGDEADIWLRTGLEILSRELPEQVLADGGHFELSPMYHAIILEDVLDLINLAGAYPEVVPWSVVASWQATTEKMCAWLKSMSHPDGEIAFFNDAAFGIANTPQQIEAYTDRLGVTPAVEPRQGVTQLSASGYVRVQRDDMVALLDVGRIGPDYLPGHAHADTLSFELSLFGHRLFVNSGTSVYGAGPERIRQRSTSAHNTLEIDGESSSEVWGGFRVARRARPFGLAIDHASDDAIVVCCFHDGYGRLAGQAIHSRRWRFANRAVSVTDRIEGQYDSAIARVHLHPGVSAQGSNTEGSLTLADGRKVRWQCIGGVARIQQASWHPQFGVSLPSQCLEVVLQSNKLTTKFSW